MERKAGERKYREVADDLRRRVNAGEFNEGRRKLPSERDLVQEYKATTTSAMTIRQALGVLRDEGLVESRVGSGWYVAEWRPIVRNALERLFPDRWTAARSMWEVDIEGRDMNVEDLRVQFAAAPGEVARALGVGEEEKVWQRNRRYVVDGVPVMRAVSFIPDEYARNTRITEGDTGEGGVYARLREAGHGPVAFQEQVRCRLATAAEVEDLGLANGAPVVEQYRKAMREDGCVVEVARMILDASKFLLVYDFPR
ncbi:GntR family transcriptional regulator [Streptomyces sp. ME02-7008A-1]|uniref:GntR family transcriptional regulator n=1 Tax=unclassified Streptomyces TaxID=2593676 RepID=UPI0029BF070E|nr:MULTISPECIES: GntR family transcriptional regulator [unclassified Streptomyces]MDX3183531.1 GntR family transcriptional regulator [Streptomyces sp. ME02-7008A-1]MDX3303983.1 GntR family transcriptional regulator [Streptomyces sp. ME02-7008A]